MPIRKSLQASLPPMALNSIDDGGHALARGAAVSQSKSITLTAVVKDALIRHYGSLKCAAISLAIDQGQLTRDLQTGDFKFNKLERDDAAKAFVAHALADAYGRDPHAEMRRLIREVRSRIDELAERIA